MSSSERIALFGAAGQLGSDIGRLAGQRSLPLTPLTHDDCDITEGDAVTRRVSQIKPTVVINAAALHQVDRCDDDPGLALRVNAEGARNVAMAARVAGARTAYVSTDYVFSGNRPAPAQWREWDPAEPLNVYGQTKLKGEQATLAADAR